MTASINEIVTFMSNYVYDSGFSVDWNTALPWVAIHNDVDDEDVFFLQEADAEEFIAQANSTAEEANVDLEIGMLAQAKQFIDCI